MRVMHVVNAAKIYNQLHVTFFIDYPKNVQQIAMKIYNYISLSSRITILDSKDINRKTKS